MSNETGLQQHLVDFAVSESPDRAVQRLQDMQSVLEEILEIGNTFERNQAHALLNSVNTAISQVTNPNVIRARRNALRAE